MKSAFHLFIFVVLDGRYLSFWSFFFLLKKKEEFCLYLKKNSNFMFFKVKIVHIF